MVAAHLNGFNTGLGNEEFPAGFAGEAAYQRDGDVIILGQQDLQFREAGMLGRREV